MVIFFADILKGLALMKISNKKMIIIQLIIFTAVIVAIAGFTIHKMVFPCRRSYSNIDGAVKLAVADNVDIVLRHLVNPESEYTILFSHGNYEDLGTLQDFMEEYRQHGFSILAWDYRGYGLSGGKPSEAAVCSDIRKVFSYMTDEQGIAPERIILHGRSVGSGPSCDLASEVSCGGLIVESGFMSIFSTKLPWVGLWGDMFVNINKISEVQCPKLFIHGKQDRVVPFKHALEMYNKAIEPKYKLWLDSSGHNDIMYYYQDSFWDAISEFADKLSTEKD